MKTYKFKHEEVFAEIRIDATDEVSAKELLSLLVKDVREWELI